MKREQVEGTSKCVLLEHREEFVSSVSDLYHRWLR